MLIVFIVSYFFPYINAIWLKPSTLFWGYIVGRRKIKFFQKLFKPKDSNQEKVSNNSSIDDSLSTLKELLKQEETNIINDHDEESNDLKERIGQLERKYEKKANDFKNWRSNYNNGFWGRKFHSLEREFSGVSIQNFLLIFVICVIVIIDAFIASHVFVSLGLFTNETLTIGNRQFEGGYPFIYGAFITIVVAIFLHFVIKRNTIRNFFSEKKIGKFCVTFIILIIFSLFLFSVLLPDLSKDLIEIIVRISWLIGVYIIYRLGEETIGDKKEYWQLLLPILLVFMILGYIIAGIGFFIGLFLGNVINLFTNLLFRLKDIRMNRILINENIRYKSLKKGHRRGFFG